jgi:hypothetical protein
LEEKQDGRDPFKDAKNEKKLRVVKNQLKQNKNRVNAAKGPRPNKPKK